MAGKRKVTSIKPMFGNKRSHSLRATRRKFQPNLQTKRVFVPELDQFVRVQVTASVIKSIDKIGLPEFLKRQGRTLKGLL